MRVSEFLERCGDELDRPYGWTQNAFGRMDIDEGPVCALGAVARVARQTHMMSADCTIDFVVQAIGHNLVTVWNDRLGRTQAEVVAAFRKAADLARTEELKAFIGEPQDVTETPEQSLAVME